METELGQIRGRVSDPDALEAAVRAIWDGGVVGGDACPLQAVTGAEPTRPPADGSCSGKTWKPVGWAFHFSCKI